VSRHLPRAEVEAIASRHSPATIVDQLGEFVSEERRRRIEAVLAERVDSVQVAIERPYDPHNAAAVVRSAEAFGAGAVHVIAANERILRARKTTTGTHRWMETGHHDALPGFLEEIRARGMILAAACVDGTCVLQEVPVDRPLVLLFGNEHDGLSDAAKQAADVRFTAPMSGVAESLNLSVSAAVSLHSVLERRRAFMNRRGDLDDVEFARRRARWYLNSVDARLARGLFAQGPAAQAEVGGEGSRVE
jgi:tRNA (guanosine-2'-O-)-methyltransferase